MNRFITFSSARLSSVERLLMASYVQCAYIHHHREVKNIKLFLGLGKTRKSGKHFRETEFREARSRKWVNIVLPLDSPTRKKIIQGGDDSVNPHIVRQNMLETGMRPIDLMPLRPWHQMQIIADTTSEIFEPVLSTEEESKLTKFDSLSRTVRKVRWVIKSELNSIAERISTPENETSTFPESQFIEDAKNMFVELNNAIVANDLRKISKLTTPLAYQAICDFTNLSTVKWTFGGWEDKATIFSARYQETPEQSQNYFGQITVKMTSKQALAVYDQFGRLKFGDPDRLRLVTDYIVFERHLNNMFGRWRVHALIQPKEQPQRDEPRITGHFPEDKQMKSLINYTNLLRRQYSLTLDEQIKLEPKTPSTESLEKTSSPSS